VNDRTAGACLSADACLTASALLTAGALLTAVAWRAGGGAELGPGGGAGAIRAVAGAHPQTDLVVATALELAHHERPALAVGQRQKRVHERVEALSMNGVGVDLDVSLAILGTGPPGGQRRER
jgi:hypothetical protein